MGFKLYASRGTADFYSSHDIEVYTGWMIVGIHLVVSFRGHGVYLFNATDLRQQGLRESLMISKLYILKENFISLTYQK